MKKQFNYCYVDESIHDSLGIVVTAFVFSDSLFEKRVTEVLKQVGINVPDEEYKSSARMDTNMKMRNARDKLLSLAGHSSNIAVFFGPFSRQRLGVQTLQTVQSVLVRNSIEPSSLNIYFDQEIFPSITEAERLKAIFHYLKDMNIHAQENSRICVGIQVADLIANSFGQIIKESLLGKQKMIDIGGIGTGYPNGTEASLGWSLLMALRYALFTRPIVQNGEIYSPQCDPVV